MESNPGDLTNQAFTCGSFGCHLVYLGVLDFWVPGPSFMRDGSGNVGFMVSPSLLCGLLQMLDDGGVVNQVVPLLRWGAVVCGSSGLVGLSNLPCGRTSQVLDDGEFASQVVLHLQWGRAPDGINYWIMALWSWVRA